MKGPMIKGNLRLEALHNFRKLSVSAIILCLMNSRENILGVRNIDPGASLHLSTHQMINTIGAHSRKGEAPPSHYAFEI
jgi:hypothetical protein